MRKSCIKSGRHFVRLLMKNTIWNGYGILVVRNGLMSISIAEEGKPSAAYMQKVAALVP